MSECDWQASAREFFNVLLFSLFKWKLNLIWVSNNQLILKKNIRNDNYNIIWKSVTLLIE